MGKIRSLELVTTVGATVTKIQRRVSAVFGNGSFMNGWNSGSCAENQRCRALKDRTVERELSLEGLLGRSGETFRSLKERNEVAGVS
jgi:hypothetical protein